MDNSPVSTQALPPGTRIEEFVIERVLGAGGFGMTYLARDNRLDRQVVIKENLPAQFCFRDTHSLTVAPRHTQGDDADNFRWSLDNFSKEAAMLASLDHPGIVKVLRSFEAFGTAYFVMPYVEGVALDELAKKRREKPFNEDELSELLKQLLSALDYLHYRGIYHRDIKPANILMTDDGTSVLIDFGSARQRLSERSMTVVESAGYTPFEQLQSRGNVGPWSDFYALAATLVKVMTGQAPPKANDRTMGDPWQPLAGREELKAQYAGAFLQTLDRALRLPIEDRWQDAKGWKDALAGGAQNDERYENTVSKSSREEIIVTKPPAKRSWLMSIAAMSVLLAATGWYFLRDGQPAGKEELPAPALGGLVVSSEPPGARLMDRTGTPVGTTPIELKGLDGGLSWEGTLEKDGYLVSKVAADVAAGETKPVPTVKLNPMPQKVVVSSEPSGAAVLEGDKVLGVTPLEMPETQPGTKLGYQLKLDGFETIEVSGEVKLGETLRLNGQMKENPKPIVERIDFTDLPPDWVSSQGKELPNYASYLQSLKLKMISPKEVIRAHAKSKGDVWNSLPPRAWWTRMGYTLRVVDRVAVEMKVKEVKIISAYRSPAYHALCSHSDCGFFDGKQSWHQANVAVDFSFPGMQPEAVTKFCLDLRDRGLFKGAVGTHGSFTHLDTRGANIALTDIAESDMAAIDESGAEAGEREGWQLVEIDKVEYVSIEAIKKFYQFEKLDRKDNEIVLDNSKVEARFKVGTDYCFMNNIRFNLFKKIVLLNDKVLVSREDLSRVIDPVLRPSYVKGNKDFQTVLLDPLTGVRNHSGYAPHGKADEVAMKVAQLVGSGLRDKGFKVLFTRESSDAVSSEQRVKKINAVEEPAIVIMIGFAAGKEEESGISTFTCYPSVPGATKSQIDTYARSICLATSVQGSALLRLGENTIDLGVSRIRDSTMSRIKHPVILMEGGFVTDPNEYRLINNDSYQEAVAQGIVDGVSRYRFAVARKSAFPEFIPTE